MGGGNFTPPTSTSKQATKKPTQIRVNWPNFIAWLCFLFDVLSGLDIVIIYFPVCNVIKFEIKFIILYIKLFFFIICITKKSGQKCKYPKKHEIKNIFHHFLRAFIEASKNNFFGRSRLLEEHNFKYCLEIFRKSYDFLKYVKRVAYSKFCNKVTLEHICVTCYVLNKFEKGDLTLLDRSTYGAYHTFF